MDSVGQAVAFRLPPAKNGVYRALVSLLCTLLGACSSLTPEIYPELNTENSDPVSYSNLGSFSGPEQAVETTRGTASMESSARLLGRNLLLDPVVRPFSTLKAFYGVALKSVGGFAERSFIEELRMSRLEARPIPPVSNADSMDLVAWEAELDQMLKIEPTSGTIRFLVDGEAYFGSLIAAIDAAGRSIHIRSYIFDNDDVGLDIANRLRARAETIEVKIIVDGLADVVATRVDSDSMPDDIRLPASISDYLTWQSRVQFRRQSNPWLTGDHVKVTLIDENVAFLGGMNIGREYRYDWHDLMMKVEGPVVRQLQIEFDQAWARAGPFGDFAWFLRSLQGYAKDTSGEGYPLRILTTRIHDSELYRAQVAAIRRARSYIYIENAYFSDDKILFELARARRRGVDVRVILGSSNDSGVLQLSNQKTINTMLEHGIRVYVYPGMTHVKAAVYDGWACLGSANFDKLSLQINHEINLGTSHPEAVQDLLESVFFPDFARSTELLESIELMNRHHLAEFLADELL